MENYDNWKQKTEDNFEFECSECGNLMEEDKQYCSDNCFEASQI